MPLAIATIPTLIVPENTSKTFNLAITGAPEPTNITTGTISVEFNGEVVEAPISVDVDRVVVPVPSVSFPDSSITAEFGVPSRIRASEWNLPITITHTAP